MPLPVEDVVAIQQLVASYCHACDTGDAATYVSLFTEEGVLSAPPKLEVVGQDALARVAINTAKRNRSPRHLLSGLLVQGDGDHATLRSYCQFTAIRGEAPHAEILVSGSYNDDVVRVDGIWKFARRVFLSDHYEETDGHSFPRRAATMTLDFVTTATGADVAQVADADNRIAGRSVTFRSGTQRMSAAPKTLRVERTTRVDSATRTKVHDSTGRP